jgi:hypothetical protein
MEVAKGSSNNSEDHLDEKKLNLFSIEDLDLETARKLASSNVEEIEEIHLWSLPTINAETAEALAKFKGMSLGLRALTELDAQTAEALAKFEGDYLLLWGLKKLDLEAAQHLACFGGDLLELSSLENPGADVEKALSKFQGCQLSLADKTLLKRQDGKQTVYHDIAKKAEAIAMRAHEGQERLGGAPYITHPERVAKRVAGDQEAVAVAWLHDVLEDTDETESSLLDAGISKEVVDAVKTLTKSKGTDYLEYLERVRANPLARKVKIADMQDNLSDDPTEKQIIKYAKGLLVLHGEPA